MAGEAAAVDFRPGGSGSIPGGGQQHPAPDGAGQSPENRRGKPDGGVGGLGRCGKAAPLGARLPGTHRRRGSDHPGTLPDRQAAGAGPCCTAGVPDRRGAAGAKGAGSLRRPRRQVLQRRLCHGGQGGDRLLRPPQKQAETNSGGRGPAGPDLYYHLRRRRPGVPPGMGGAV